MDRPLDGSGAIELGDGQVLLKARDNVMVGSGFIRTTAGGDISITALHGDVNAGTKNDGYEFTIFGERLSSAGLGGIATANGGDVMLKAGRDVISVPLTPGNQPPGASGATRP